MKKYKYITILQVNNEIFGNKPVYRIFNNRDLKKQGPSEAGQLGLISFYKPWKQYVFSSQPECVFNNSCLRDVLDFIENHTEN